MATAKSSANTKPAAAKAVAKVEEENKAVAAFDYGEDSGAGFEGQDSSHLAIPFYHLLQSNSPQCTGEDATARPGQLINSVTGDVYSLKEGVYWVPACTDHVFTEWVPREKGGGGGNGFRGVHAPASAIVVEAAARPRTQGQKRAITLTEEGNELVETFQMYGVLLDKDHSVIGMGVLPFASTKIKVYRGYMTKINLFNHKKAGFNSKPPLFANMVKITSKEEVKGSDRFYNLVLTPAVDGDVLKSMIPPDHEAFNAARDVWNMVRSGEAKASYETAPATNDGEVAEGDGEIPF